MIDKYVLRIKLIWQTYIITVFVYGLLEKKIYNMQLTIFQNNITWVFFFKNNHYCLKKSYSVWYQILLNFFSKLNFYKTEMNHGLFFLAYKTILITIYMDDLLLLNSHINSQIDDVIKNL